jgi:hypothetical protein
MASDHTERTPEALRGYRKLSDMEKEVVDRIKLAEADLAKLWAEVYGMARTDRQMANIAKTSLQDSFMWFVRSVTQPLDVFEAALEAEIDSHWQADIRRKESADG